jgi:membrane carboxypeptidase/penicillin-binding protein
MPAAISAQIVARIKADDPAGAKLLLDGIDATLSPEARAEWRQKIAWSFYIENDDASAYAVAQTAAEGAVQQLLPDANGPAAVIVAIDNDTGEVRAMVGGRATNGEDFARSPFNLATQGERQPGSAFKPFVLAAALRKGISRSSTWASRK